MTRDKAPTPVFRPLLPRAAAIAPYLERLDRSRTYANRGELVCELETRLGERLGLGPGQLLLAGSGTAALAAAILAVAGRARPERPLCLCPGYTFVAAPLAAELCGYQPYLLDVDPLTWMLDPAGLAHHAALAHAGLVLAGAPYGRSLPQGAWAEFSRASGVPVVLDAAAGIERFADGGAGRGVAGPVPVVLSLHATKPFATGEGGAIVCEASDTLLAAAAALNFGFAGRRETVVAGFNGKMSEYHAAVGLAELDGWTAKRADLQRVAGDYSRAAAAGGVRIHAAPSVGATYVLWEAQDAEQAVRGRAALAAAGLDSRLWYGAGLHREPHFAGAGHDPLPAVEDLAPRLVGLPVAGDLPELVITRVLDVLAGV